MDRRAFLGSGLVLAVSMARPLPLQAALLEERLASGVFLELQQDSLVRLYLNKSEMGQGVMTGLAQIVADELGVAWDAMRLVQARAEARYADPISGRMITGGSTSIRHMWRPLQEAAAVARELLIQAAAATWAVEPGAVRLQDGLLATDSGHSAPFGQFVPLARRMPWPDLGRLPLRPAEQRTLVGRPVPRIDIPDKVQGLTCFGLDARPRDVPVAVLAWPPALGARPGRIDRAAVEAMHGVRHVVPLEHAVAVVADSTFQAMQGAGALTVEWQGANRLDDEIVTQAFAEAMKQQGMLAVRRGEMDRGFAATQSIEALYELPYLAHVAMEPMNCTVLWHGDHCQIHVGTQNQTDALATAARVSGLPPERIEVQTTFLGGGFGRRLASDMVAEAVAIARAIDGSVQLVHRREHDFQAGMFRPGCHSLLKGAVGEDGAVLAWSHHVATQPLAGPGGQSPGVDRAAVAGVADMPYAVKALEVRWSPVTLPIPVWPWRSVGASHNAFVVESFVDELAHLAKADPLAYRLSLLQGNEAAQNVLRLAASKAGYRPKPPGGNHGQGIAYHYSFGSHCAMVMDVTAQGGQPQVERVVVALDCGPVVNPDLVAAQVEGAVIMGLSAAMKEAIHFAGGGVHSINLHQYDLLRCDEAPRIEVHLASLMSQVGGAGEPALPPVAPALANGYCAATGRRVRRLPFLVALTKEPDGSKTATPAS